MSTLFRRLCPEEVNDAHATYIGVYEWLNAKGIRQWLQALSKETFARRERDGQLFTLNIDERIAAVVTLAFETNADWVEAIGAKGRWWIKTLAVVRARRGAGVGPRVMRECESLVRAAGASDVFLDCVDTGYLPRYYTDLDYEVLAQKEITYPSGYTFPMVLMKKKIPSQMSVPTAASAVVA